MLPVPLPSLACPRWEAQGPRRGPQAGVESPFGDPQGLQQESNELRADKLQDGVEGIDPPEVDVMEITVQILHQLQILLIVLGFATGKVMLDLARGLEY